MDAADQLFLRCSVALRHARITAKILAGHVASYVLSKCAHESSQDGVENIASRGKTFATGVSDASGSVPRFGEAVIEVPVTASAFRMLGQAMGMMTGGSTGKIDYEMKGKLSGSGFNTVRFQTKGEFELPTTPAAGKSQ